MKDCTSELQKGLSALQKNCERHIRFRPSFAADDYVYAENASEMSSAADKTTYKKFPKLLRCHTAPYEIFSFTPDYAKIDRDSVRDTVLLSRLTVFPVKK